MRNSSSQHLLWLVVIWLIAGAGPLFAQSAPAPASSPAAQLPLECLSAEAAGRYTPLRKAIGSARVVMLGEQSHFDGATFAAKIDLIRYLHDSLGFTTLAFEGDMYALDKARREIAAGKAVLPVLQKSVYEGIWSGTAEFQALAAYLTTHPTLRLAGFDCQLSGEYTAEYLLPELRAFVALDRRTAWQETDFYPAKELLAELSGGDFGQQLRHPADSIPLARWFRRTRASLAYLAARPAHAGRAAFWQQWLRVAERSVQDAKAETRGRVAVVQNPRDALMADNLLFLTRPPEHAKIIVWAASYHLANKLQTIALDDTLTATYIRQGQRRRRALPADEEPLSARQLLAGGVPMGRLVKEKLGDAVYALGFVAYDGTYGRAGDTTRLYPVPQPPPGSVEAAFQQRGCALGFVNLRHSLAGSYYASPLGYLPLRAPWEQVFDGFFFTRTMRPTTALAMQTSAAPAAGRKLLGQVRDASTGAAVSFASVSIQGTSVGTVTNLAGGFALFVPAGPAPDTVQVSCLGYASVRLALARQPAGQPLRLTLVPQAHLLGEVVVRAPPNAEAILTKAREHIMTNYPQQAHSTQLYARAQHWRGDSLHVQVEAALAGYDQEGYRRGSWEHARKQRFLQVRQQRKTGDPTQPDYQAPPDFWLLWSDDPVLTTRNPLEAAAAAKYRLTLKGQTQYDNRAVYEVGFVCERPNAFTTPYGYPAPEAYEGTVYVDTENFAVVKYEAFTTRSPRALDKPKELTYYGLTQPATYYRRHHDVYQYAELNGTYFRQYVRRETTMEFVQADSLAKHQRQEVQELLTTSVELAKPQVLQTSLYEVDTKVPYRPEFWDTYQVLLPTERKK